jgi:hypothetical protein
MKLTTKKYKTNKTLNYIKTNSLFLVFNGINSNASNWIKTEQELYKNNVNCHRIFNKTSEKTLTNSVFYPMKSNVNGTVFFIKPTHNIQVLSKKTLFTKLELLRLTLVAVKFNNKVNTVKQLQNLNSLDYKDNKLLFYQFSTTILKLHIGSS